MIPDKTQMPEKTVQVFPTRKCARMNDNPVQAPVRLDPGVRSERNGIKVGSAQWATDIDDDDSGFREKPVRRGSTFGAAWKATRSHFRAARC